MCEEERSDRIKIFANPCATVLRHVGVLIWNFIAVSEWSYFALLAELCGKLVKF